MKPRKPTWTRTSQQLLISFDTFVELPEENTAEKNTNSPSSLMPVGEFLKTLREVDGD